jgi:RecA-family ATPase
MTAADLLKEDIPPLKWVIPGFLPEGLTILAGKPKTGKSFLIFDWGLSVAYGGKAMGQVQVEQGDVLCLALEDGRRRLQDRLRDLVEATGSPAPERLFLHTVLPGLANGGLQAITRWIESHPEARLVIIDTLAKIRPPQKRGGNVYQEDYSFIGPLQELAKIHRIGLVLIHHVRKSSATDKDFIESVSGTLGLSGAADTVLVLARVRGEQKAVLHVTGRDVEEGEFALGCDLSRGQWTLLGDAKTCLMSDERKAILELLKADGPMTTRQVADSLGRPRSTVANSLTKMVKDEIITTEHNLYSYTPLTPPR